MPFYEYECKQCGHALEAMQKINDAPLKKCPECGKGALQRLMSAPVFRLKGAGWYETDFKSDQEGKRNLADRPETESSADDKKDAKDPAAKDAGKDGAGKDGAGKDGAGKDASAAPQTEAKSADAGTASAGSSGDKRAVAPVKRAAAPVTNSRGARKAPARPAPAKAKVKARKPAKPVKKAKSQR